MGRTKADKEHRMAGKKEQPTRTRVHRSIYLEQAIYDRLGEAYKTTSNASLKIGQKLFARYEHRNGLCQVIF